MKITGSFLLGLFVFFLSGCQSYNDAIIRIAAAANTRFALEEIVKEFEASTGLSCELITSSSGKLTAQIIEGAPYDVFLSADLKYPDSVYAAGLALSPPKVYAYGKLVLCTTKQGIKTSIKYLESDSIQVIAIANPKTAPYGQAALEAIQNSEVYDQLKDKLVYGESVLQVNQFIQSGAAQIGFSAKSTVMIKQAQDDVVWSEVGTHLYEPMPQGVVLISENPNANKFYNYLFSDKAKEILNNFGYLADTQ